MADKKMEKIGTCAFCGQTRTIETIGDDELTQAELDAMATERCMCVPAQEEKRKKARKKKINDFVNKKFPSPKLAGEIFMVIDTVEDDTFEEVTLKLYPDKNVRVWKDSDSNLHIKIKRIDEDELKA